MIRGGTITGHVRDAEGKLASNVTISAGKSNSAGGFRTFVSKTTDDRGEYRLFWLPPGEYYVGAGMMGTGSTGIFRYFNNWTESSIAAAGLTFYPNASSVADAQTIVVKEGDEVPGIDLLIRR
jgi:hypothetical protein